MINKKITSATQAMCQRAHVRAKPIGYRRRLLFFNLATVSLPFSELSPVHRFIIFFFSSFIFSNGECVVCDVR